MDHKAEMRLGHLLWTAACLTLVSCSVAAPPPSPGPDTPPPSAVSPSAPTTTPTAPSSTSPAVGEIELRLAPADLGCDAITVPYKEATFRIDPAASDQVSAVTDTGTHLRTYWSAGFRGGSTGDHVVRDPAGRVVATDGEVVTVPDHAWARLHGYFVCTSQHALYILEAQAWESTTEPSALPAGTWGPLAVLPPQDGTDTGRLEGTLRITDRCVYLEAAGENVLLVWHADQVTWNEEARSISFENLAQTFEGSVITLSDGDRAVIGGSGGGVAEGELGQEFVSRMDWVSPPAPTCSLDPWWSVGAVVE